MILEIADTNDVAKAKAVSREPQVSPPDEGHQINMVI